MKWEVFTCVCSILIFGFFQETLAETTVPKPVQEYLKHAMPAEDGSLDVRDTGYYEFDSYLKQNWRNVLENIQVVAPTDIEKCVVIAGCERLSDEEYLLAIQMVGDLFEKNKINIHVVNTLFATSMARQGFMGDNWKNPIIRSFLEKVRSRTVKDKQLQSCISDILSGRATTNQDTTSPSESAPTLTSASHSPVENVKHVLLKSTTAIVIKISSKTSRWPVFILFAVTFLAGCTYLIWRKNKSK